MGTGTDMGVEQKFWWGCWVVVGDEVVNLLPIRNQVCLDFFSFFSLLLLLLGR
jgi:hypothetical protein